MKITEISTVEITIIYIYCQLKKGCSSWNYKSLIFSAQGMTGTCSITAAGGYELSKSKSPTVIRKQFFDVKGLK